ncbi:head-tail connector protein [Citrobacter koseri]|uniref:Phage gp6-like head-tail connector protein n=1 Tax=Citrobacter koseri TaxID=545 RepID=A0A078LFN0_CITKO|nr:MULTISPECIES: head-tail connector protein [Citrobacter]EKW1004324.1 phage gp6-like head-tail connector protein [Citrobacter koseri]EKX8766228.1 phage gp6-like head-tail connector protein [Citrobacter koseri]ELJ2663729.1 phage gp6-like head-tail connector protein [Citrobacter koseri]EMD6811826.1 phage gp6-like head-tail connector protein [Citrobacter koseri]MBJ8670249.1 phage gp6-like head-tail connector protein [Citrobacter koseri]
MLLKMEEIKLQLRLDEDFTDEDSLLELLGNAVQSRTENFLNRKLYATEPTDDPDGLVMSDDVKLALLMLVTHFYENRSAVTEVEKLELPMSFKWLVGPYRYIPL